MNKHIETFLEQDTEKLLDHVCTGIPKERLTLPEPRFVDRSFLNSDRTNPVLGNLQRLYNAGRLGGTGYLSLFPVDQGIEHSAGASFSKNPDYFDPRNIVTLAIEGGCNGVASTAGVLGQVAREFAHHIPFILKLNHNELLSYPNTHDQIFFTDVDRAADMGAAGVGATIYFGSEESNRQIEEVAEAFSHAHDLGLFTVLWCYVRNEAFHHDGLNDETSADLTGQANHLGVTLQADLIKQKQATHNGGYQRLQNFGKTDERMYTELTSDNPIDLCRWQVSNCYMGRIGLINSGGASGDNDYQQAVRTAVINKRAGGCGLISGRKVFQRPRAAGIDMLHAIQDVYLEDSITVA
ncbi:MAG: class I fructose-bisphosphate aldolase [Kiritimatiellae bacterium]|jgi:class I fructose-bisphosphate aldolase|nr:class I fructose-bisphosphate aldolase [Kiritimatiellia bacterium]